MNTRFNDSTVVNIPRIPLIELPVSSSKPSFLSRIVSFFESISMNARDTSTSRHEAHRGIALKKYKKYLPIALLVIIVLAAVVAAVRNAAKPAPQPSASARIAVDTPKAQETLNKDFTFPLKDASGKDVSKIKYTIQNAELRDEIIVQGRPAYAIEGKTFLILTIKITNNFDQAVNINARDYVRLTINGKDKELVAADIHNDPVSVQPISTKTTRIGFPINDTDKNLVLYVGEIKGDKTKIPLKLK